jgi:PAS domain S-box-containing protein
MNTTVILAISTLLQFAAAFWALRLIWVTGRRTAWALIAAAIFLMAIRRLITLFQADFSGVIYTTSLSAELVAMVISLLMLGGVVCIGPLFQSLKQSERELRKAHDELEIRVQERTATLTETNQRLEAEITERKKAEDALQQSQQDLNRAQAVALTGSWRLDIRRNELLWSDETYRIFGIAEGMPMTYETFLSCVHPEDREDVDQKWRAALHGEDYDIEHRIILGNKVKWVREKAELEFDEKGALKGGFGTVQDITELKKIDEMKDEFIGLVSHELRTPLTVITGSLRTSLSEGLSPEDVRELIQNAAEGADSLAAILDNMLELSRYQAGRLQLNVEPVNIASIAQSVIGRLKNQGAQQRFSVDLPSGLPLAQADPMRVERILYNLLENAVKYSPATSEIKVFGRTEKGFVITEVTDLGKGISPDDQDRLFELFQRLETQSHTKGVGLGLVVCKRLVEAQGGWIKMDSAVGRGSTFSFALPIHRAKV